MEGLLRIGDFGVVCGLNLRTLRHYQDMGLLEEPTMPITVTDTWVEPVTVVSRRITGPTGMEQAVTAAGIYEVVAAHGSIRMPFRIRLLAVPPIWGAGPVPRFELVVPYDG